MVSAVYCLTVKFLTPTRVGYIKVDQVMTRQCHIQAVHLSKQTVPDLEEAVTGDVLAIERDGLEINIQDLDPREDYPKLEPVEQIEEIEINGEGRTTRIGTRLSHDQKGEMIIFERKFRCFCMVSSRNARYSPFYHFSFFKCQPSVSTCQAEKKKLGLERLLAVR